MTIKLWQGLMKVIEVFIDLADADRPRVTSYKNIGVVDMVPLDMSLLVELVEGLKEHRIDAHRIAKGLFDALWTRA